MRSKNELPNVNINTTEVFVRSREKTVQMGMHADAIGSLLNNLTDFYVDPVVGAVRETIANGIDATKSSYPGVDAADLPAIEITTPSIFNMTFTIRDHASGMSADFMEEVVFNYGGTTKRNDISSVGCYGLGFKAPLAYNTSFNFVSVKDGMKSSGSINRLQNGPTAKITVKPTDEDSGTTIIIPVKNDSDIQRFNAALETYKNFSFEVPIIIDGIRYFGNDDYVFVDDIVIYEDDDEHVNGRLFVRKSSIPKIISSYAQISNGLLRSVYVLAGFSYNANNPNLRFSYDNDLHNIDYFVEILPAVVNFPSSRDQISIDDKLTNLNNLVNSYVQGKDSSFYELLKKALPRCDKKTIYSVVREIFIHHDMNAEIHENDIEFSLNLQNYSSYYGSGSAEKVVLEHDFLTSIPDGVNVFDEFVKDYQTKILSVFKFYMKGTTGVLDSVLSDDDSYNMHPFMNLKTGQSEFSASTSTDVQNKAKELMKEKVYPSFGKALTFMKEGVSFAIIVKNVHNDKDFSRLLMKKKAFFLEAKSKISQQKKYPHAYFIVVDDMMDDSMVDMIRCCSTDSVVCVDFDDYDEIVKRHTVKRVVDNSLTAQQIFNTLEEGFSSYEDIIFSSPQRAFGLNKKITQDDYDNNSIFVVLNNNNHSWDCVVNVLLGYYEEVGDEMLNRPIVIIKDAKKNIIEALLNNTTVIFPSNFVHSSKIINDKIKDHKYHSKKEKAVIQYLSVDDLRYSIVANNYVKNETTNFIYDLFKDREDFTHITDVFNFVSTYVHKDDNQTDRKFYIINTQLAEDRLWNEDYDFMVSYEKFKKIYIALRSVYGAYGYRSEKINNILNLLKNSELSESLIEACLIEIDNDLSITERKQ